MGRKGLRRKAPRWLYPAALERQYMQYLLNLSEQMEANINNLLIKRLPQLVAQANFALDGVRADDFVDDIKNIMAAITVVGTGIYNNREEYALGTAVAVSNFNAEQYRKIINATLGVDPLINDSHLQTRLKAFSVENAALIRSIPEQLLKDVEGVVMRGMTQSATADQLTAEIQQRFKVSRNRARLIARDQTGKLNAQLTKVRQQRVDIDEYIWNSASDERVRDSHRVLDGKICRWDNDAVYREPNSDKWLSRSTIGGFVGIPGGDYQCRCFAEPILDDFIDNQ